MTLSLQSAAAFFSPQRLQQARHLAGLTRTELARRASVSGAVIGQYESGATRPRPATVGQLALALAVPVEFLTDAGDRELPLVSTAFFRSLRSTSKREREQAAATAALLVQLATAIERHVELPPVRRAILGGKELAPGDDPREAEHIANDLRRQLGLADEPVSNMVRLLEQSGVIVARLPFHSARVDAFSWTGESRPIVVLGTSKNGYERSRFDAAHELGHIVMHRADAEPADQARERQANRFASAFLMPDQAIRSAWPAGERLDWNAVIRLKHRHGVALSALLYRAKDLELLTPEAHQASMRYLTRRWGRAVEPGFAETPEQPGLIQAALALLSEHGVSLSDIATEARLLNADDLADRLGLSAKSATKLQLVVGH